MGTAGRCDGRVDELLDWHVGGGRVDNGKTDDQRVDDSKEEGVNLLMQIADYIFNFSYECLEPPNTQSVVQVRNVCYKTFPNLHSE